MGAENESVLFISLFSVWKYNTIVTSSSLDRIGPVSQTSKDEGRGPSQPGEILGVKRPYDVMEGGISRGLPMRDSLSASNCEGSNCSIWSCWILESVSTLSIKLALPLVQLQVSLVEPCLMTGTVHTTHLIKMLTTSAVPSPKVK